MRLFDPTRHTTRALTFRDVGPISRFDHHRTSTPAAPLPDSHPLLYRDRDRRVYYAAVELSCCIVEVFGDTKILDLEPYVVARVTLKRPLHLLDLHGSGSMRAGTVSAVCQTETRSISQQWSRYFFDSVDIYGQIDGIYYPNAHNSESSIALYERGEDALACGDADILPLNDPDLRTYLERVALDNGMSILQNSGDDQARRR